jgi:hypothetical protein
MSLRAITEAANGLAAMLELLERSKARGLKHPRHSKSIKPARAKIKAVMVHFFERQRKAVLAAVKPRIERQLVLHPVIESKVQPARDYEGGRNALNSHLVLARESSAQGKTFARSLMPTSLHPLTFSPTAGETSDYNEAITDLIGAAAESLGGVAGPDFAGDYLRENSLSKLSGGLDSTSIERLQDSIATAWDKGGSYDDIVSAITETFDDFSETRAGLIAQTESADAYNAGRFDTAKSLDFSEKAWETESGDPCPTCEANEAQGYIDIDEDFESGDDAPTAHPNCLCVVNFRKSSDEE